MGFKNFTILTETSKAVKILKILNYYSFLKIDEFKDPVIQN